MPEERPLIDVRQLTVGYGRRVVLENVDLPIYPRDFLAIIGPNGGGKTTLLAAILGLLAPWSGSVTSRLPDRRGALGYVPQTVTFDESFPLRVGEVVVMGRLGSRGLFRRYTRKDRADAEHLLERLEIADLRDARVAELSGGELRRVLIARALVSDPEILFLDEPLASLDAAAHATVRAILMEANRRIPIVIVTHDLASLPPDVRHVACVNRTLHYHAGGELTAEALEQVYGCPVEAIGHGVPHRILRDHSD